MSTAPLTAGDTVPVSSNGIHAGQNPVTADHVSRDHAAPEPDEQTEQLPTNVVETSTVEQNGVEDDLEPELDLAQLTNEALDALIPSEPSWPDTEHFQQLYTSRIARDKGRPDEINSGLETATIKLPLKAQDGVRIRNRVKTRLKAGRDTFSRMYPGLRALWRTARQQTTAARNEYGRLCNELEQKLSAGGFNPHVKPTLEGITQAIYSHPEVTGQSAAQATSSQSITAMTLLTTTGSTTPPVQVLDPTPAVPPSAAELPQELSTTAVQEATVPEEDTTSSPITVVDSAATETTASNAGTPPIPPVKPETIPLPERPSADGRPHWSRSELAITVLLALIIGMVFGGAFVNAFSGVTVQDLEHGRSGIGNLFVFIIGPALVLMMGEVYKYTTAQFVQMGHSHITRNRHSNLVLYVLATVMCLFSLADIMLTANLFRQVSIENNLGFGTVQTPPFFQFLLWGLLLSTPLMVIKALLGHHHGLEACRVWNQWTEETQRIEGLNAAATTAYEAQMVCYQQDCDAAQRQKEAVAQAERQDREAAEARQREAAVAAKRTHQAALEQETRVAAERDAEAHRREQRVNDIRENNPTIKEVMGLLPSIAEAGKKVTDCEATEYKIKAQIDILAGKLALTPEERRDIAKADLATMLTVNDAYRGLRGTAFFDDEALDEVRMIVNTSSAPSNSVPAV
jgi:hypothetical protein